MIILRLQLGGRLLVPGCAAVRDGGGEVALRARAASSDFPLRTGQIETAFAQPNSGQHMHFPESRKSRCSEEDDIITALMEETRA